MGRAPRAPTQTPRGPWALQDLCPQVTFFTGFSAVGTQLMSSQCGISWSSSVLSQHDRPPWLTSPLGTWKLRPDRQRDQKLRGVAETALFTLLTPGTLQGDSPSPPPGTVQGDADSGLLQKPRPLYPGVQFTSEELHHSFLLF